MRHEAASLIHCTNMPSFPAANSGSLNVQLWLHVRFVQEGWRERNATSRRKELLTKLPSYRSCRYAANMRTSCGGGVCVCGSTSNCFWQPAGRRKPVPSPGVDGASSSEIREFR
jgi:hypothetical protein